MIESTQGTAAGSVELHASGTVLKHDVELMLRDLGKTERLLVLVMSEFDGYMAELLAGFQQACSHGVAERCALVVPEGMATEARLRGEADDFRVFHAREAAEHWLSI